MQISHVCPVSLAAYVAEQFCEGFMERSLLRFCNINIYASTQRPPPKSLKY